MAESNEMHEINIQLEDGSTGTIMVDYPTFVAVVEREDQDVIAAIVQKFFAAASTIEPEDEEYPTLEEQGDSEPTGIPEEINIDSEPSPKNQNYIWTGDRSTLAKTTDVAATAVFLQICMRPSIQALLKDKKTAKLKIWNYVAAELRSSGFLLEMENAASKCQTKYRNLEKSYKDYIQHQNSTGQGTKNPPQFIAELQAIFGDKHSISLPLVVDTLSFGSGNSFPSPTSPFRPDFETSLDSSVPFIFQCPRPRLSSVSSPTTQLTSISSNVPSTAFSSSPSFRLISASKSVSSTKSSLLTLSPSPVAFSSTPSFRPISSTKSVASFTKSGQLALSPSPTTFSPSPSCRPISSAKSVASSTKSGQVALSPSPTAFSPSPSCRPISSEKSVASSTKSGQLALSPSPTAFSPSPSCRPISFAKSVASSTKSSQLALSPSPTFSTTSASPSLSHFAVETTSSVPSSSTGIAEPVTHPSNPISLLSSISSRPIRRTTSHTSTSLSCPQISSVDASSKSSPRVRGCKKTAYQELLAVMSQQDEAAERRHVEYQQNFKQLFDLLHEDQVRQQRLDERRLEAEERRDADNNFQFQQLQVMHNERLKLTRQLIDAFKKE